MKLRSITIISLIMLPAAFSSCKKSWLDTKPRQSQVTLNTVKDLQAVLDNTSIFNSALPSLLETGADNYYYPTNLSARTVKDQNIYKWAATEDFWAGSIPQDWEQPYKMVYYANTVLEEIEKIEYNATNYTNWANVKGSALFYRANAFYIIAQLFCKPYIKASASQDLGIILRLQSNINTEVGRSSVQQTYDQIISDLIQAKDLLPTNPVKFKTQPSKRATFALLARTYLTMEDYDAALAYSDSTLKVDNFLLDYKTLTPQAISPYAFVPDIANNQELIFYGRTVSSSMLPHALGTGFVDSLLYQSYSSNDKRQTLFYKLIGTRRAFTGSYAPDGAPFYGFANDEMYLTRAECYARKGNTALAMGDLNALLQKRHSPYSVIMATDANDALLKILAERRKELCFRGVRWTDLRRLNLDTKFAVTIKRSADGQSYNLPPNDQRYVYPIPNSEILYNKVPQNPR